MTEQTEVCNARLRGTTSVCHRTAGHPDDHYNRAYTVTWTDEDSTWPYSPWPNRIKYSQFVTAWLSEREVQVLQTAADGLTTEEAAAQLGLHTNTVKTHKSRILRKLGAQNTAHAVAMGFRAGAIR